MNYEESLAWLYGTQWTGIKLGLENIRRLLGFLGVARPPFRFLFHVAGTNGKGSVCAMLDALCRAAGLRTGLYTSPHLVTFRERIRLDGAMIPEADVAAGLSRLQTLVKTWEPQPTFFELATALAVSWFRDRGVEAAILETGLGGRLDATNALDPTAALLTSISLDHQQYLGDTLGAIAAEKAGILKPGIPAFSTPQLPEAHRVIEAAARSAGAPLEWIETPAPYDTALPGSHQRLNAALALAALAKAGISLDEAKVPAALQRVEWPGRFQRLEGGIVLDGAHNEAAAARLVETWREVYGDEKPVIVAGILADKAVEAILARLAPLAAGWIITPVRSPRANPPQKTAALARALAPEAPCRVAASLEAALKEAKATGRPILVTGSLFLVGEALALLQDRPADPASAQ